MWRIEGTVWAKKMRQDGGTEFISASLDEELLIKWHLPDGCHFLLLQRQTGRTVRAVCRIEGADKGEKMHQDGSAEFIKVYLVYAFFLKIKLGFGKNLVLSFYVHR